MMPDTTLLSAVRPRRVRPLLTAGVVWAALAVPVASGQTTDIIPAPPDPRPYVRLDAVGVPVSYTHLTLPTKRIL